MRLSLTLFLSFSATVFSNHLSPVSMHVYHGDPISSPVTQCELIDLNGDLFPDYFCSSTFDNYGPANTNAVWYNTGTGWTDSPAPVPPVKLDDRILQRTSSSLSSKPSNWTRDDVAVWAMHVLGLEPEDAAQLWQHRVRGATLATITAADLSQLGLSQGAVIELKQSLSKFRVSISPGANQPCSPASATSYKLPTSAYQHLTMSMDQGGLTSFSLGRFVDINGDGLVDLIYDDSHLDGDNPGSFVLGPCVYLNTGSGWALQ